MIQKEIIISLNMSVHPQYVGYGRQYSTSPPPPPPSNPGYSYAPAKQMQPMDSHAFRQFYSNQLAQLTFNSRPIIQNLSMMAQEYSRMAHVVAQCLETHTRLVSVVSHFKFHMPATMGHWKSPNYYEYKYIVSSSIGFHCAVPSLAALTRCCVLCLRSFSLT